MLMVAACTLRTADSGTSATEGTATTDATSMSTTGTTTGATTEPTTGDAGDAHPVVCEVATRDLVKACLQDPCPIDLDVELRCDDDQFAAAGLRVTASPHAVWLATSSAQDAMLHRFDAMGATRMALPPDFAGKTIVLATAPAGDVHAAANATPGAVTHVGEATDWAPVVVADGELLDVEVDLADTPHVWTFAGAGKYSEATRFGDTWSVKAAKSPDAAERVHFGFTRAGDLLAFGALLGDPEGWQVRWRFNDNMGELGWPEPSQFITYRLAPPTVPVTAATQPILVAAIQTDENIQVLSLPSLDSLGIGMIFESGATKLSPSCDSGGGPEPCPDPCHDTAVGLEPGAFAFARTIEGLAWLAFVTTHLDRTISYAPHDDPKKGVICQATVESDESTGVLHVWRAQFDGLNGTEVVTLPVAAPAMAEVLAEGPAGVLTTPRAVDMRTFANTVALGLRARDGASGSIAVRVLRIDTTAIVWP